MNRIEDLFNSGELFDGRYKLVKLLSNAGGSADVWLAVDMNTMESSGDANNATKVVIKVYRPKNLIDMEGEYQFRNEFKKVFNCHHANIITPTYFSVFEDMPYLVLPYCPAGSSEMLIGRNLTVDEIWKYIYEVASGLAYLHGHSPCIIHQDIKPANVLIDDNGNYAISDFGISTAIDNYEYDSGDDECGTFAYMAPERFREQATPKPESDVWAFGATVFELITGDAPFGDSGGKIQQDGTPVPSLPDKLPASLKQLVTACLAYSPEKRPSAKEIVDTVLKRRYSQTKKMWSIGLVSVLIVTISAILLLSIPSKPDPNEKYDTLLSKADSIVDTRVKQLNNYNATIDKNTIDQLNKAKLIYGTVCADAPGEYLKDRGIEYKIILIDEIISEFEEYEYTLDLSHKAQMTEMEEEYIQYSLESENHKATIHKLILQL